MEYDIFISYSRKDSEIVNQFVQQLTDAGYSVWIDREGIYSGDQFATKIVEAIESSDILLFFSSVNSNASEWTVREIYYALSEHKTIIPIKIDEAKYDKRIALNLILIDFIQYQQNDFSSAAERLIASVAKHLGESEPESDEEEIEVLSPEALYDLGKSLHDSENYEQAVEYYQSAAEQGHPLAQYELGIYYEYYLTDELQDHQKAADWFLKSAEQGCVEAQKELGECYYHGKGVTIDYEEAVKWFSKAAEQGNEWAQVDLGECYYHGHGVPIDQEEAAKWFRLAAEKGNQFAQNKLGICYYHGYGFTQNYIEAVEWFRKAAEQGNEWAQYNLGNCYKKGHGVVIDAEEAAKWYLKAAEQGHEEAQYNLGICYESGKGVPKDLQEAIKWYSLAAEQGNTYANRLLGRIKQQ